MTTTTTDDQTPAAAECEVCFAPGGHHWPRCRNAGEADPDDDVRLYDTAASLWELGVDPWARYG